VIVAGTVALVVVLATDVWPKRPEMGDRFLVLVASAVLLHFLRPHWQATPCRPAGAGLFAVAAGAIAFPPAWFLLVQVGPRTVLLWWLAVALILAAVGLLAASNGWRRTAMVVFPLVFALFALPAPDVLQALLLPSLKGATTAGAAAILPWLGVPAVRSGAGFTLTLPSGKLGVVDACSGALSLTSLLAIAVFVAYIRIVFRREFTIGRALALVVLTVPIVVVSNTLRVIVSGWLYEHVGIAAVQGLPHVLLGYMVIVVGFGLIVGASQLLARRRDDRGGPAPIPEADMGEKTLESSPSSPLGKVAGGLGLISPAVALLLLLASAGACLWAEQFRQGGRQIADFSAVPLGLGGWDGADRPVPPDVAEMLKCDQLIRREYTDRFGRTAEVYVMFWATPASTAHMHHPDVCWPSRGCTLAEGRVRPVPYATGREPLGVSVRHYETEEGKREVVFYWTQSGNSVLPDGQEPDRRSEYAWVVEMIRGGRPPEQVSRLSVLIAAEAPLGRPADQEERLSGLCGRIAAEVYGVCPWAAPPW
jgi:exosortase